MQACNSCQAGCCRNFTVALTGFDLMNISKTLGVDLLSFIQMVPVIGEENIAYRSEHSALFKFSDAADDNFYLFGMRMVESQLVPGTIKCQFLQEWYLNIRKPSLETIISRCGIYNCRPLLCATYPTQFDSSEQHALIYNMDADPESVKHKIYNLCREKFKPEEVLATSDDIIQKLVLRKYEVDYFKNLAASWNENPSTIDDFLNLMIKTYNNRVVIKDYVKSASGHY